MVNITRAIKMPIVRLETRYPCLAKRLVFSVFFIIRVFFRVVIFVVLGDDGGDNYDYCSGFFFTMVSLFNDQQ